MPSTTQNHKICPLFPISNLGSYKKCTFINS
jgi:hypothetical protein